MGNKEAHFEKVFWFVVGISLLIIIYIFMVTFAPIPKDNIRFADGALGFLLGILSAAVAYLVGGNPNVNKKSDIADKTTTDES